MSAALRPGASFSRTASAIARSACTRSGVDIAHQSEVEEAHPPVRPQQVVPGMRVAERDPVAVEQAEEEPEHDLPVAVALASSARRTSSNRSPSMYSDTSTRRVDRSV